MHVIVIQSALDCAWIMEGNNMQIYIAELGTIEGSISTLVFDSLESAIIKAQDLRKYNMSNIYYVMVRGPIEMGFDIRHSKSIQF